MVHEISFLTLFKIKIFSWINFHFYSPTCLWYFSFWLFAFIKIILVGVTTDCVRTGESVRKGISFVYTTEFLWIFMNLNSYRRLYVYTSTIIWNILSQIWNVLVTETAPHMILNTFIYITLFFGSGWLSSFLANCYLFAGTVFPSSLHRVRQYWTRETSVLWCMLICFSSE